MLLYNETLSVSKKNISKNKYKYKNISLKIQKRLGKKHDFQFTIWKLLDSLCLSDIAVLALLVESIMLLQDDHFNLREIITENTFIVSTFFNYFLFIWFG